MATTEVKAVVAAVDRFPEHVRLQRDGLLLLANMVYKVLSKTPSRVEPFVLLLSIAPVPAVEIYLSSHTPWLAHPPRACQKTSQPNKLGIVAVARQCESGLKNGLNHATSHFSRC